MVKGIERDGGVVLWFDMEEAMDLIIKILFLRCLLKDI